MSTSSYDRVSLDLLLPTEDSTSSSPPFPQVSHFNKSEKYTIVFEDELLHIDSSNWRTSTLLKVQIFSAYCVFILFGLAEQTIGSIIPILQKDYSINDLQVSLIFISSITGYFTMALINDYTHKALGIKGVVVLGSTSMTLGYLIISTRPPFFIFALCYVMSGIGFGSLDAGLNGWMGNLIDSNQLLGILHGCYGIGCMISPPLITYLLEKHTNPWKWNHYYIVLSVVGCCCVVLLILTFKNETPKKYKFMGQLKNEAHKKKLKAPINDEEIELDSLTKTQDVDISDEELTASDSEQEDNTASLLVALKSPLVWAFATILFIYVGGEVAFGAWLMTFLIRIKKFPYKLAFILDGYFLLDGPYCRTNSARFCDSLLLQDRVNGQLRLYYSFNLGILRVLALCSNQLGCLAIFGSFFDWHGSRTHFPYYYHNSNNYPTFQIPCLWNRLRLCFWWRWSGWCAVLNWISSPIQ